METKNWGGYRQGAGRKPKNKIKYTLLQFRVRSEFAELIRKKINKLLTENNAKI